MSDTPGSTAGQIWAIPYHQDLLAALAHTLLQHHAQHLPDLSRCSILLPGLDAAPRLRGLLLEQAAQAGHQALLGPEITTLRDWINTQPLSRRVIDEHSREIVLFKALREHSQLFGNANAWGLVDELIRLFDELTLNQIDLPPDIDSFIKKLHQAYGLQQAMKHLGREANIVHTLWHAWHRDLQSMKMLEPCTAYLQRLHHSLDEAKKRRSIYLAGFTRLSRAEHLWLQTLLKNHQATLFIHGLPAADIDADKLHPQAAIGKLAAQLAITPLQPEPPSAYTALLDAVYLPQDHTLKERAEVFARQYPQSPLAGRLALLYAGNAEEEARAVDVQVRQWLLDGHQTVGIVTENRRLARRIRALLERAGISLDDSAGWALSTTSAASALEAWLRVIEEDFAYRPLLDLLKSSFILPDWGREQLLTAVYRLEQDIILHENINRDLSRYRRQVTQRAARLPTGQGEYARPLLALLDRLEQASQPLMKVFDGRKHPAASYLRALLDSLAQLGMRQAFDGDAAGQRLLQELELMAGAQLAATLRMDWLEFRTWLGRTLERYNFQPPVSGGQVRLMSLKQSPLQSFDALVIAGAEREFLHGNGANSPFFNDAVRRELGLAGSVDRLNETFHHFRRLLDSAQHLLISLRLHQDGEDIAPSPWVEHLNAFHTIAYGQGLENQGLKAICHRREAQVINSEPASAPEKLGMPQPQIPGTLVPSSFSSTAYQQLLDCPYQFYAARCLKLSPPDKVREAMEKADFGQHVHRCLQAFHSDVPGLPGPFRGDILTNRQAAIECLGEISQAVFAADLEDNFQHRGWLKRWLAVVPRYIDWQARRQEHWQLMRTEASVSEQRPAGYAITGRLDRIDQSATGQRAVVDYKTGKLPNVHDVRNGEAVQLPFYALLFEAVVTVEYLSLDINSFGSKSILDEAELSSLSERIQYRLDQLYVQLKAGGPLPAWGDEQTCGRCVMAGICRRESWS
ncbi:MAG: hypothetical protein A2V90_04525 [Gammaproteobacteria bacterium RBG_16_57_12]|nr:MAG: hypothetical protein A2V90_04525 [Gammaproteobacteria bacterium RBG_16_57_12]